MSEARIGTKKRAFRSNKETDEEKTAPPCQNSLTKKAPYKEPPGELSIDPVADERLGRATGWAEAS
jgi:hypothetical protein